MRYYKAERNHRNMDSIAIYSDRNCRLPNAEQAITPARFRERVAAQFLAPENLEYLRLLFAQQIPPGPMRGYALKTLRDAAQEFGGGAAAGDSRILDEIASDPLAQRGELTAATDLWSEVRRINRIFFEDRIALLREQAALISAPAPARPERASAERRPIRDGLADDNESYGMRMFISDSLRPPGLERLNGPGPDWAILEDQSSWLPKSQVGKLAAASSRCSLAEGARRADPYAAPRDPTTFLPPQGLARASMVAPPTPMVIARRDAALARAAAGRRALGGSRESFAAGPQNTRVAGPLRSAGAPRAAYGVDLLESPEPNPRLWGPDGPGRTNMDPAAAVAEYWSDDWPAAATTVGSTEIANVEYGAVESWGDRWQENGGTRFMRYESIPFWQQGGRSGYEYDIEETLGTAGR